MKAWFTFWCEKNTIKKCNFFFTLVELKKISGFEQQKRIIWFFFLHKKLMRNVVNMATTTATITYQKRKKTAIEKINFWFIIIELNGIKWNFFEKKSWKLVAIGREWMNEKKNLQSLIRWWGDVIPFFFSKKKKWKKNKIFFFEILFQNVVVVHFSFFEFFFLFTFYFSFSFYI